MRVRGRQKLEEGVRCGRCGWRGERKLKLFVGGGELHAERSMKSG